MVLSLYQKGCGASCNYYFADIEGKNMMETKINNKEENKIKNKAIHKAKDNSLKSILAQHELFIEFLRDFVKIDLFDTVEADDIEDITERFLPLFDDNKDSDTVKRVNIKGEQPMFVLTLVEAESEVNYRATFKMLQYIVYILADYEKEANKIDKGSIYLKDFRYPPVLPIVFYDGGSEWTAARYLEERTEFSDIFGRYIPKFDYELISLNDYTENDLIKLGDVLSLIMLVDKIRDAEGINILKRLPDDYKRKFDEDMPSHLNKLIADVIMVLLRRINVPDEEIEKITEPIYERKVHTMFDWIDYDVQETRRLAGAEMFDKTAEAVKALCQGKSTLEVAKQTQLDVAKVKLLQNNLKTK
jgi:hypothetical protein